MNAPRDPWPDFAAVFADELAAKPLTPEQMDAMAKALAPANHNIGQFCTYCGDVRLGLSCCGEVHFITAQEFFDYHGEWPADYEDAPA